MKFKAGPSYLWYPTPPDSDDETRRPILYGKHTCGCGECDPILDWHGECHSPAFFTVKRDYMLQPFCGDLKLDHCVEVMTGRGGWALMISTPTHICENCHKEVCRYRMYSDELAVTNADKDA